MSERGGGSLEPRVSTDLRRDRLGAPIAGAMSLVRAVQHHPGLLLGTALLMTFAQLGFRAWALYPSWFFLDDYNLLHDALSASLGVEYLFLPYNGHLMPAGRLVVWVVQSTGPVNWALAATLTLLGQLLASLAAWWMLTTLFGKRWFLLVPFAIYLSSAVTLPALLWWSAALTLLPMQASFFAGVATWVTFLRGGRRRWLLWTAVLVLAGLAFDVKAILIVPVLLYLQVVYFESGSVFARLRALLRRRLDAVVLLGVLVAAYSAYYVAEVPPITGRTHAGDAAAVADTMLGTAFPAGILGGPWRWENLAPPTAYADPPGWAVHVCWVVIAAVVAYGWLRRTRTASAWVLVLGYLVALWVLVVSSRGGEFGAAIGLEYRYLTDAVCVVTLSLGLAFLPLPGAPGSSRLRTPAVLAHGLPRNVAPVLTVVVVASGCFSSAVYAGYWHHDNASDPYVHALQSDLQAHGKVDLADQPVPEAVLSHLTAPLNTTRRLAELLTDDVSFPSASPDLAVVADDGGLRQAHIELGVASPPGPVEGCGWLVTDDGLDIPLTGLAYDWTWWVRIGYLAGQNSPVDIVAGDSHLETEVQQGLNNLYVKVSGSFDEVSINGLDPGMAICVDTVEVGQPTPGAPLS